MSQGVANSKGQVQAGMQGVPWDVMHVIVESKIHYIALRCTDYLTTSIHTGLLMETQSRS